MPDDAGGPARPREQLARAHASISRRRQYEKRAFRSAVNQHDRLGFSNDTLGWVGPLMLCRDEVDRIPPAIAGVYMIHVRAIRSGGYPVAYVGQSVDLRRRLQQHLRPTAKPIIRATLLRHPGYWSGAPVFDPGIRRRIEASLIALLEPRCNCQTPGGAPAHVNLPPMFLNQPWEIPHND